ncbi:pyrroline-5-carboxylate reductase family protein, partial [Brevundimonas denitrificans]|uniref:pyrroline-5-carboxylate reductase family protein n=1 Tax=Brevundimonas denitrificans TaxID=1443434 RepID=UPI0024E05743
MSARSTAGTVALVGCGRLGSAILEGWLKTGAVAARELIIFTPSDKPAAEAARAQGARVNPPIDALVEARALVLAVKPAKWREALGPLVGALNPEAVIVSVMAGVAAADISAVAGRPVARVMPTTAVAQGR